MAGQGIGHIIGHHAQILTDHHAVGAGRLDGQNAEHDVGIVMHIGTIRCRMILRNPPQTEQTKDMVDAHGTGTGEHTMHHVAVGLVASGFQIKRAERRLAPILALLVEHIRRSANRSALGEPLRIPPHIRAEGMHTDRHIRHDADFHAGILGRLLRSGKLIGRHPFEPAVEVERIGELTLQISNLLRIPAEGLFPIVALRRGRTPLVITQAPRGIGFEVGTEIRLELVECGLTLGSATGLEDNPQSMHLAAPHGVTVNDLGIAVQRLHIGVQSIHFILGIGRQCGVFRYRLRANIREIDQTTAHRKIRRRRKRRHRFGGVQRIDQHKISAGLPLGVDQYGLQILVIADTP